MSGGAFNYACRRVEDFAEELRAKIANNGKENDYGEKCEFSAQTIARLQSIVEDAERTAKLMKAAERLYSGDTGEDDLAVSVMNVRGADYEAGRAAEQSVVAKWLDERGKYCEGVADEHVDDHQTCRKWEIRAHEAFTSASAIREGRHK